jgi:acetolactate synthase-1/2/3 large subunit
MAMRTGARLLVDALAINGTDTAYCVPGESYLQVLDALLDVPQIRLIVCRQEGGAANMADAYGKLTGRPGICFVTRGPGATNASIGIHTAMQDSTPLILFVGQAARGMLGREAFQEVDLPRMFAPLAKWSAQIDSAKRIPEMLERAFAVATSGRQGPVVLALPEDVLSERAEVADVPAAASVQAYPGDRDLRELRRMLVAAERPLLILGGSGWDDPACKALQAFAHSSGLPVTCSFRRQDLFDNRDPHYAGDVGVGINPALAKRIKEADLILAIGARLGEMPTGGYTLIESPKPKQRFVHVHADPNELGRVYRADLAINAGSAHFARALSTIAPIESPPWKAWTASARADYEANIVPAPMNGTLNLAEAVHLLSATLPEDAIVCNGAGNYAGWVHRFFQYKRPRTQLAPTSGAMGYGVPASVAAKLRFPERTVVSFAGDGCFLMNGQELATAVQYGAAVVIVVVNNGMYGTIRMHQERTFPGRISGTDLVNPDFVALAEAYGAYGELVERTEDFAPAFGRAARAGRPALLELRVDPSAITTRTTIAALREAAASHSA